MQLILAFKNFKNLQQKMLIESSALKMPISKLIQRLLEKLKKDTSIYYFISEKMRLWATVIFFSIFTPFQTSKPLKSSGV